MNRKVNALFVLVLGMALPYCSLSQNDTWYSTGSGSWGDLIWSTSPTGPGTLSNPDNPTINLVIQSGHAITLHASEKAVAKLSMEVGSSLQVGGSTTRYVEIYGDAELNGTVGGSGDGLSFDINGPNCQISGIGQTYLKRLRKDNDPAAANTTNLVINQNITLTHSSSNSAALYNNGAPNSRLHITIRAGKTVKVTKADVSIDGIDGSNSINLGGSILVEGTLDIEKGDLWLTSDNGSGYDITYQIGKNGKLFLGGNLYGNQNQAGVAKATLSSSGQLWLEDNGHIFQDIHSSRNSFIFQSGARIVFSQTNTQYLPIGIDLPDVTIRGGGNKRLQDDIQINGTLRLEGGFLTLGDYDLTVNSNGNIIGGSSLSYIKTNGIGALQRRVGSTITNFPIGYSSYNPVKLFNTFSADPDWYRVRVKDEVLIEGLLGSPMVSEAVDRTWIIEEAVNGGSDLFVELQWNPEDELSGFDREACFVSQWLNNEWQIEPTDQANGNTPYRQQIEDVQDLSPFSIRSTTVLPIELQDFRAKIQENGILLQWQTLLEENNNYIAIERSINGIGFEEIGKIKGKGTHFQAVQYAFLDPAPVVGINYYRLKQVDFDGTTKYHQIISEEWAATQQKLLIYPTVADSELNLSWATPLAQATEIQISNYSGQVIKRVTLPTGSSNWKFQTADLNRGYYLLSYRFQEQLKQARFVVNR